MVDQVDAALPEDLALDHSYPILEFDPIRESMIEPEPHPDAPELPERAVGCFFHEVLADLVECGELRAVHHLRSEMGKHPVYEMTAVGKRIAIFHPGLGAPFAAAFIEEMIAHGCRKFVVCGGCGVLDGGIACGHLVVPISAVRDEGTSYHYVPPGQEVAPSPQALAAIRETLDRYSCPYVLGKTWTTDAIFRETRPRIARRAAEGCLTVEMEAAAIFAVAQFRGVALGQILYGGDDLSGEVWDPRQWNRDGSARQKLFRLAVEACAGM